MRALFGEPIAWSVVEGDSGWDEMVDIFEVHDRDFERGVPFENRLECVCGRTYMAECRIAEVP